MNDAWSSKSGMKTCFISTYSTDSRKTSIQLSQLSSRQWTHICASEFTQKAIVSCQVGRAKWLLIQLSTYLGKIEAYFQIKLSRACVNPFLRMRCHRKGKIMDIKAMIFFFAKDCRKSPKTSLKIVICACKWKFGSTTFHCSNSVMHELWTLNCLSNERREAYLSIYVHLIKQIYDYDSKKLQWNSVSFILGHTVLSQLHDNVD